MNILVNFPSTSSFTAYARVYDDRKMVKGEWESLCSQVKQSLQVDLTALLQQNCHKMANVAEGGFTPDLHRALKKIKHRPKRPTGLLANAKGDP